MKKLNDLYLECVLVYISLSLLFLKDFVLLFRIFKKEVSEDLGCLKCVDTVRYSFDCLEGIHFTHKEAMHQSALCHLTNKQMPCLFIYSFTDCLN